MSYFPTTAKSALVLACCVFLCLAVGGLGSMLTTPGLEPWYAGLQKPGFNPPNWIFAPVWSALFVLMAYALWRIWSIGPHPLQLRAYQMFAVQLALNLSWSGAFFFLQNPGLGLFVIICLLTAILITLVLFFKLDRLAGMLFVPYVLWVGFATLLNLSIFLLN